MFRLVEFDESLNLSDFYKECDEKGYTNNNSQKRIWDRFKKYKKHNTWIFYRDFTPMGSVVAHSFDEYKKDSFRVLVCTCVLEKHTKYNFIGQASQFKKHQHFTAQFYIPKMIEWCGINSNMFITTHPSETGKTKKVHNFAMRVWSNMGLVEKTEDIQYRGVNQTVCKLNAEEWLKQLKEHPIELDYLKE